MAMFNSYVRNYQRVECHSWPDHEIIIPMTDPWCCSIYGYIYGNMDPINIPQMLVYIYIYQHHGSVMGFDLVDTRKIRRHATMLSWLLLEAQHQVTCCLTATPLIPIVLMKPTPKFWWLNPIFRCLNPVVNPCFFFPVICWRLVWSPNDWVGTSQFPDQVMFCCWLNWIKTCKMTVKIYKNYCYSRNWVNWVDHGKALLRVLQSCCFLNRDIGWYEYGPKCQNWVPH